MPRPPTKCEACNKRLPKRPKADQMIPFCDECLYAATLRFMPGVLAAIANRREPEVVERDPARTPGGKRARAVVEAVEGSISWDDAQAIASSDTTASVLGDERDD